jgi:hypothetical protein
MYEPTRNAIPANAFVIKTNEMLTALHTFANKYQQNVTKLQK